MNASTHAELTELVQRGVPQFDLATASKPAAPTPSPRATVKPYGFDMVCQYEYTAEVPAVINDLTGGDPGADEQIAVLTCFVGGVDIHEMLNARQHIRIADAILSQLRS